MSPVREGIQDILELLTSRDPDRTASGGLADVRSGTERGWLLKVTSSRFELKDYFSSLDIRVCLNSLLEKHRTDMLPIIFQPFTTAGSQEHDQVLLPALRSIAADPSYCSSEWLVGHFTLDQMDHLERLFEPYGRVPWDELINPLWNELLSHVEGAWLALYSSFILPVKERLPLTYPLVDRAESPSGGYSDAPPCAPAPPIPTVPILTPALDCASSGLASVRVDGGPGLSLALRSRLQRSPGYRRRNQLSCVRVPNTPRDKGSPAGRGLSVPAAISVLPSCFSCSPISRCCFFIDCATYAKLKCILSPHLDASAWAEIPLALVGYIVAY